MRPPCGKNGKTFVKPTPVNDKKSEFHESDTVRSMVNRLDVEKGRPSGKPGSFCSGIPDMCDQESPPSVIPDSVYRESIFSLIPAVNAPL
jgi:hypothetical protein